MKLLLQILFLLITWFTNQAHATPVFTKVLLPSYDLSFSKIENIKIENIVKIGVQNFARSGIENRNHFSNILNGEVWANISHSKELEETVNGVGKLIDDALALTLKSHPNFSKLGLSVTEIDDFKALLNTKMPNSASDVFGGLKSHLDAGTSFENMQQMISGLKNNWGNFSDGSKWVFNYTSSSQDYQNLEVKKYVLNYQQKQNWV
jgi:hypothetical protein